jgi:osmotically-inducible protein OsmY
MSRFLVVCLLLVAAGCKARDGDVLRKIARKTGEKLEGATGSVGQMAGSVPVPAVGSDVTARVQARLRWDRYLADSRIDVRGRGKGVIVLKGQVSEASVKQRALDLARSTVGVERVSDEVKVKVQE